MGFLKPSAPPVPAPPPPPPTPATMANPQVQAAGNQTAVNAAAAAAGGTLTTPAQGAPTPATAQKTLLGQ